MFELQEAPFVMQPHTRNLRGTHGATIDFNARIYRLFREYTPRDAGESLFTPTTPTFRFHPRLSARPDAPSTVSGFARSPYAGFHLSYFPFILPVPLSFAFTGHLNPILPHSRLIPRSESLFASFSKNRRVSRAARIDPRDYFGNSGVKRCSRQWRGV